MDHIYLMTKNIDYFLNIKIERDDKFSLVKQYIDKNNNNHYVVIKNKNYKNKNYKK